MLKAKSLQAFLNKNLEMFRQKAIPKQLESAARNMILPPLQEVEHNSENYFEYLQKMVVLWWRGPALKKPMSKVVIIGVHGWFPLKIFNRVIGEPIGTSHLFASKMQKAVLSHFDFIGQPLHHDNVTMIPIEGEGRVLDRVETLFNQLVAHKEKISDADMIIFSAHSQGSPVSALLLSRLIKQNYINPATQKTGILAMAGISHGPFPTLKSSVIIKYVESDPAKELFDFNNPTSPISLAYHSAMKFILDSGCRYTAIGSWYDQVVPLYSAVCTSITHPNIFRALYIDQKDYTPDFLSHLLVFCLKLRNLGLEDYQLVVYLSEYLAGSIYGFGTQGHQAVYEEDETYLLGLKWVLHYGPIFKGKEKFDHLDAPLKTNPYYLPWIMARLFNDPQIMADESLREELEEIRQMFFRWHPASGLKELRYRLDPIKSKL